MAHLHLVTLVVGDYDRAITFFGDGLDFDLVEDVPSTTNDGRPKRWVVVRPKGGESGVLLARADGPHQEAAVGRQFAGHRAPKRMAASWCSKILKATAGICSAPCPPTADRTPSASPARSRARL